MARQPDSAQLRDTAETLERIARELYGARPADFVAERTRQATAASDEGDRDLAGRNDDVGHDLGHRVLILSRRLIRLAISEMPRLNVRYSSISTLYACGAGAALLAAVWVTRVIS